MVQPLAQEEPLAQAARTVTVTVTVTVTGNPPELYHHGRWSQLVTITVQQVHVCVRGVEKEVKAVKETGKM
jgi:hypothetical protein